MDAPIVGYLGVKGVVDVVERGENKYLKFFNDTGTTLNEGDVVFVEYFKDTITTDGNNLPTVATPATSAVTRTVGVVVSGVEGQASAANGAYGWVQVRGYCKKVTKTTADAVAIDDTLKATNNTRAATREGTTITASTFAIAKSALGAGIAGTVEAWLLGRDVTV